MIVNPDGQITHLSVMLIGSAGVGKSTFIGRFLQPTKPIAADYRPTLHESTTIQQVVQVNNNWQRMVIQFIECGGQFVDLQLNLLENIDSFLLMYSVTDKTSFNDCLTYYQKIIKMNSGAKIMLIGTQVDLTTENQVLNPDCKRRYVSTKMGENLAYTLGIPFLETSALAPTSVLTVMKTFFKYCQDSKNFDHEEQSESNNTPIDLPLTQPVSPVKSLTLVKKVSRIFKKKDKPVSPFNPALTPLNVKSSMFHVDSPFLIDQVKMKIPNSISFPVRGSTRHQRDMSFMVLTNKSEMMSSTPEKKRESVLRLDIIEVNSEHLVSREVPNRRI
ncbi:P-loop containing nucleoside triphosphate hydrolase protein [Globomyces pollinis-pini]|nr:P-loop containing nucleoside triphosphate hydrolase protein [Globomyces pollinis-pini]